MIMKAYVLLMQEPLALNSSTGYLLARAGTESRRRFVQALDAHDVTLAEYGALMILGESGPTSQRSLAESIGVDARNLVPVLDALEARRLLRRDPSPADRRRHVVTLTDAGRRLLKELARAGARAEAELLAPLTPAQRRQLHNLLGRLLA